MNDDLHLGPNGANLIKSFEGCRLTAYIDPPGLSIGWGHSGRNAPPSVSKGMTITQKQADQYFLDDMVKYENYVKAYVSVPLNQNQFDALCSLCFNIGPGKFRTFVCSSGLNRGDYSKVAECMKVYNTASGRVLDGLTRRRAAEGALFNRPVSKPSVTNIIHQVKVSAISLNNKLKGLFA